jgi:hypothetical protein
VWAALKKQLRPEHGSYDRWEEFQIVQCGGCQTISFSDQYQSAIRDPDDEIIEVIDATIVYPSAVPQASMSGTNEVPESVRRVYVETHAALCNKLPVLAGIGIRAIVEAVCKDRSALGANLEKRIDSLAAKGFVTPDGAKILHSLRFMGNDAAHEVKQHEEAELATAFLVVEHLLQTVYVIPEKAKDLLKSKPPSKK